MQLESVESYRLGYIIWPPFCLCKLEGQKLKIRLGNRNNGIQHTQIMLKSDVPHFYLTMLVPITFIRNVSSLIDGVGVEGRRGRAGIDER